MDTMIKIKMLTIAAIFVCLQANGQNYKVMQDSFASSYKYEQVYDYAKAIKAIKAIYTENSYETNLRMGWLTYLYGNYTESADYYQKAIKLMPYAIEPKLGYVYPLYALGSWDLLKKQYEDILIIDPQNSTANYWMGYIYYVKLDYNTAYKYVEKVVNLYPFDYDGLLLFANINLKMGKTNEAKLLFNKALMYQPGDKSALEGLNSIK
jgi:tetratricopeptide (TPR) repeat protein